MLYEVITHFTDERHTLTVEKIKMTDRNQVSYFVVDAVLVVLKGSKETVKVDLLSGTKRCGGIDPLTGNIP